MTDYRWYDGANQLTTREKYVLAYRFERMYRQNKIDRTAYKLTLDHIIGFKVSHRAVRSFSQKATFEVVSADGYMWMDNDRKWNFKRRVLRAISITTHKTREQRAVATMNASIKRGIVEREIAGIRIDETARSQAVERTMKRIILGQMKNDQFVSRIRIGKGDYSYFTEHGARFSIKRIGHNRWQGAILRSDLRWHIVARAATKQRVIDMIEDGIQTGHLYQYLPGSGYWRDHNLESHISERIERIMGD